MKPDKHNKINYSSLKRYFEDSADPDEIERINSSLLTWNENDFHIEKQLHLLWKEIKDDHFHSKTNMGFLLDRIHHKINLKKKAKNTNHILHNSLKRENITFTLRGIAKISAIILLPLIVYLAWESYGEKTWLRNQTEVTYNEIICPLGARSNFTLPDGTTGNLNNGSSLKYPAKFTRPDREVQLTGEAFFDVAENKKKPFIIRTEKLHVKVLGTRLNICSYPEDGYQEFTVEEGTIEIFEEKDADIVTLAKIKSGQLLTYNYNSDDQKEKKIKKVNNNEEIQDILKTSHPGKMNSFHIHGKILDVKIGGIDKYTAWKEGKLILRNDPMTLVLSRIERWYNVKFNIKDPCIFNYTFWATFEEESLDEVLHLLSFTSPIEFIKKERVQKPDGTYYIQEIDVTLKNTE